MTEYKVLIVDDEPLVSDVLSQIFELNGYEVRTASNGQEASKRSTSTARTLSSATC